MALTTATNDLLPRAEEDRMKNTAPRKNDSGSFRIWITYPQVKNSNRGCICVDRCSWFCF